MNNYTFAFGAGARGCIGRSISLLDIGKAVPDWLRLFDVCVNPALLLLTYPVYLFSCCMPGNDTSRFLPCLFSWEKMVILTGNTTDPPYQSRQGVDDSQQLCGETA
jgi:hypothetical protein